MQTLNGFKIDQYNVHKLNVGVKLNICPLCSADRKPQNQKKKVLMCDWDTGIGTCQHCGEVIQLHTYKKKEVEKVYKRPTWQNNTDLSNKVVKWFEGRKISQFALRRLKVSEGKQWMPQTQKDENTIHFNYFRDDELINVKYRDGAKHFKMVSDAEKIPYNLDNIRTTKECIIVEGEIDVLSCVEAGFFNTVSSPNGSTTGNVNLEWLDNSYEYFENKDKIFLALDADEPGQNVQKELIRRLGAEKCFLVDLSPYKDFNEVLCKENTDSIKERIENAKQCPLENVIKYNDIKADLRNFYLNGSKPGYQIGLTKFDEMFSTYTSQFFVVTGIPSSGKSDFVDQMCVGYNLNYGFKTAYCSAENKPTHLHVDKIARKFYGKVPRHEDLETDKWKKVEDHLENNFYFIDYDQGYNLTDVLKKGAELVKRKGIKVLVIDPFNKVPLKESNRTDINQYTNDYLNAIDVFCKVYDVLVILVAHPKKMNKQNGVTPEPDFYDVKGGGEFYDMSYHGLLVHRNYELKTVKVKVLKVKFSNLGENGAEQHFKWDYESGRYNEFVGVPDIENMDCKVDNTFWLYDKQEQQEFENLDDPLGIGNSPIIDF